MIIRSIEKCREEVSEVTYLRYFRCWDGYALLLHVIPALKGFNLKLNDFNDTG